MALLWYEYALIAAIFAGILSLAVGIGWNKARVRVQKWIGGAIGNFMTGLAKQAAEEEGPGSSASASSSPGVLNLGGFKLDAATIKMGMELLQMLKGMGLFGGGSGGTANPFLK